MLLQGSSGHLVLAEFSWQEECALENGTIEARDIRMQWNLT